MTTRVVFKYGEPRETIIKDSSSLSSSFSGESRLITRKGQDATIQDDPAGRRAIVSIVGEVGHFGQFFILEEQGEKGGGAFGLTRVESITYLGKGKER
jgi:hypothetical protein